MAAHGFDVTKEITNLFKNAQDEGNKTKLAIAIMEYVFPKAATTQMLNIKDLSENTGKMSARQLLTNFKAIESDLEQQAINEESQ